MLSIRVCVEQLLLALQGVGSPMPRDNENPLQYNARAEHLYAQSTIRLATSQARELLNSTRPVQIARVRVRDAVRKLWGEGLTETLAPGKDAANREQFISRLIVHVEQEIFLLTEYLIELSDVLESLESSMGCEELLLDAARIVTRLPGVDLGPPAPEPYISGVARAAAGDGSDWDVEDTRPREELGQLRAELRHTPQLLSAVFSCLMLSTHLAIRLLGETTVAVQAEKSRAAQKPRGRKKEQDAESAPASSTLTKALFEQPLIREPASAQLVSKGMAHLAQAREAYMPFQQGGFVAWLEIRKAWRMKLSALMLDSVERFLPFCFALGARYTDALSQNFRMVSHLAEVMHPIPSSSHDVDRLHYTMLAIAKVADQHLRARLTDSAPLAEEGEEAARAQKLREQLEREERTREERTEKQRARREAEKRAKERAVREREMKEEAEREREAALRATAEAAAQKRRDAERQEEERRMQAQLEEERLKLARALEEARLERERESARAQEARERAEAERKKEEERKREAEAARERAKAEEARARELARAEEERAEKAAREARERAAQEEREAQERRRRAEEDRVNELKRRRELEDAKRAEVERELWELRREEERRQLTHHVRTTPTILQPPPRGVAPQPPRKPRDASENGRPLEPQATRRRGLKNLPLSSPSASPPLREISPPLPSPSPVDATPFERALRGSFHELRRGAEARGPEDRLLRGMRNPAYEQRCYLNAGLQALLSVAPFTQLLRSLSVLDTPELAEETGRRTPTLHGFIKIWKAFFEEKSDGCDSSGGQAAPVDVRALFSKSVKLPPLEFMEDSDEVMFKLVNSLDEELAALFAPLSNSSPIAALFEGCTVQQVHDDGTVREKEQRFFRIHVDSLPKLGAAGTVAELLATQFTRRERVSETLSISSKISKLPQALCLTLQRFSFDITSGESVKCDAAVTLSETLEVAPSWVTPSVAQKLSSARGSVVYELVGVISHHGTAIETGHYTCIVKIGTSWISFDDVSVRISNWAEVQQTSRECYQLVYARQHVRGLRVRFFDSK